MNIFYNSKKYQESLLPEDQTIKNLITNLNQTTSNLQFIHDKDNKKISIVFDFENESNPFLELYKGTSPIKDVCPEKFFHPFSDKTSLLFPLVSSCVKIYKMDENMEITLVEFPNVMKEILE